MKLSFTGTQDGMTDAQKATVRRLLTELKPTEVHHGDCVGADDEFADICAELDLRPIIAHPGKSARGGINDKRANNPHSDAVRQVKNFVTRNRDMVDLLRNPDDRLLATPKQSVRASHGGTWFTIYYGERQGKMLLVVWPDGTVTEE